MVPYIYQVHVDYYDESDDRFWYVDTQVESNSPLSRNQVFARVDELIAQKLVANQYEALREFLAEEQFEPSEEIVAAYFVPP